MSHDDGIEAFCRAHEISRDDVEALLKPLRAELAEARELVEMFRPWFDGPIGQLETSRWTVLLAEYTKLKAAEPEGEPTARLHDLLVCAYNALWTANRHYSDTLTKEGGTLLVFMEDRWRITQELKRERAFTVELAETVRQLSDTKLRDAILDQARKQADMKVAAAALGEALELIGMPGDEPLTDAELKDAMGRLGPAPRDVE